MIRVCLFLVLLTVAGCSSNTEKTATSPNIIWLVAEDQSPDFFPMYGDKTVSLPHLEALAKDGITFNNAYAPVPVCAPARSSLITGMYPTSLGTHNMRTYNAYQEENQPSIGIPSYSPLVPENIRMFTEYLRAAGYYCTNNAKEDYNFKKVASAWDESSKTAHWKNRAPDQAFFAVFNFNSTHESQIWGQADQPLLVAPESVPVPPILPDHPIVRKDLAVNYSNLIRMDQQIGKIIAELKAANLYDNSIIFFYGDHGGPFPRYKRALYETGLRVPLVIKFPENKNAGSTTESLISFIDFAPTVLSLAGVTPPAYMQGKALFGTNKSATPRKFIFASSDRFDEQVDRLRAVRHGRFKYIKNFNPNISNALPVSYRQQMPMMQLMDSLWKEKALTKNVAAWFETPKPLEELYDIEQDPFELINLADQALHQDTLRFLRQSLETWMLETQDLGAVPEKELLKQWFPNGKIPVLAPLKIVEKEGQLMLSHPKKDVTIVWKSPEAKAWKVYGQPLAADLQFTAKAVRIGYEDSPILSH